MVLLHTRMVLHCVKSVGRLANGFPNDRGGTWRNSEPGNNLSLYRCQAYATSTTGATGVKTGTWVAPGSVEHSSRTLPIHGESVMTKHRRPQKRKEFCVAGLVCIETEPVPTNLRLLAGKRRHRGHASTVVLHRERGGGGIRRHRRSS